MRDIDALEIYNNRNHANPLSLANEVITAATYGKAGIAWHGGKPAGIVGVSPIWSGVWSIWSFGTDDWPRCVIAMTRYGKRVLQPHILRLGAHRLQCESRVDHVEAHAWLKACGAKIEGTLRRYGRDGSDYYQFAWTKDDI